MRRFKIARGIGVSVGLFVFFSGAQVASAHNYPPPEPNPVLEEVNPGSGCPQAKITLSGKKLGPSGTGKAWFSDFGAVPFGFPEAATISSETSATSIVPIFLVEMNNENGVVYLETTKGKVSNSLAIKLTNLNSCFKGLTGPTGATGAAGPTGAGGATGPAGTDGTNGTSRGFFAENFHEIEGEHAEQLVGLSELPAGNYLVTATVEAFPLEREMSCKLLTNGSVFKVFSVNPAGEATGNATAIGAVRSAPANTELLVDCVAFFEGKPDATGSISAIKVDTIG